MFASSTAIDGYLLPPAAAPLGYILDVFLQHRVVAVIPLQSLIAIGAHAMVNSYFKTV